MEMAGHLMMVMAGHLMMVTDDKTRGLTIAKTDDNPPRSPSVAMVAKPGGVWVQGALADQAGCVGVVLRDLR